MMRIESLKYFVVTADCRSMTLSSKVLHISQQCISREIKQLEEELGRPLFWRSKAGVALTEEGQRAYRAAQAILQQFAEFQQIFHEEAARQTLTVGSYIGFKMHIETILNIFQGAHPQMIVDEYYSSTEQLEHELGNGLVDFALRQLETKALETTRQPLYATFVLAEEPVQILVNAIPANAELKRFDLSKMQNYPILFYCDSAQETPLYQRIAQRYCEKLNILYKGNNMEKSWSVFERRNAVAVMTKSLSGMMQTGAPVRLVPIEQEIMISTVLSVRKDLLETTEAGDLIEVFQAFFQQFV